MASSTNLLGTGVHEVMEEWSGQGELKATNKTAKASQKDIHFFRQVAPTESPKIMGLEGIQLPKALWQWSGLSFYLWCGKEGQNEGTVVNHMQMTHYHLGLICACCLNFFTMSSDNMWQHALVCKSMAASDSNDNRGRWQQWWWLPIQIWWGLDSPILSTSHPIVASLTLPFGVHARGRPFLLRPSSSLNYFSFQQCWYLLMTHYVHLCR